MTILKNQLNHQLKCVTKKRNTKRFGIRQKRKILLFLEMEVTRKMFCQIFFVTSLIGFFKWSLHLKSYSNSTFLCWKTKSPILCSSKRKKHKFVWINFLVENRLDAKFYWPKFFHYGFKIQWLTWTLDCRSQNLQPASTS